MEALRVISSTCSSSHPLRHLFHLASCSKFTLCSPRFRCPPPSSISAVRNRRSSTSATPPSTSDRDAVRSIRLKKVTVSCLFNVVSAFLVFLFSFINLRYLLASQIYGVMNYRNAIIYTCYLFWVVFINGLQFLTWNLEYTAI